MIAHSLPVISDLLFEFTGNTLASPHTGKAVIPNVPFQVQDESR
jgi:hypothetical protein